ncbi:MAG: T9SS type A sorting domain-containing protein [Bacteroidia bacterium]
MKAIKYISAAFLLCCAYFANAQKQGSVWCFGDSALVDFSDTANIITGSSMVKSRGSCASIADSAGSLLFYAGYNTDTWAAGGPPFQNGEIWNKQHQIMQNGDSIVMQAWYHEVLIIDNPSNNNQYYVFSIGVTGSSQSGLYYSIVDMSANGGLGAVIQKNVQLHNYKSADGLTAIKHGNGRDWWIINRRWNNINNTFYKYLITPSGVSDSMPQNIGYANNAAVARMQFSNSGNKLAHYNGGGLLELYDFDRCTGLLSNLNTVYPQLMQAPLPWYWSTCFSPDDNLLYISSIPIQSTDTSRLYQFDLTATNIAASADTLRQTHFNESMGFLKLAPDGKIYLATSYYQYYPYKDTMYNNTNMYLSTINSPNNLGSACDLQPYSFYLGGKRTYGGLPNNPDYELGAVTGSACDTLTGIAPLATSAKRAELFVTYMASWKKLFVNAQHLKGKKVELKIMNITGKIIYSAARGLSPSGVGGSAGGYFTQDVNCSTLAKGMYIVSLQTEKERLVNKFIVE